MPFLQGISPDRIEAARLVLLEGMTNEGAAKTIDRGWSRQAVGDCVRVVRREFEAFQKASALAHSDKSIPEGWERVSLVLPSELLPEVYALIARHAPSAKTAGKEE